MKAISTVFVFFFTAHIAFAQIDEARDAIDRGEYVRAVNILSETLARNPVPNAYLYLGIAYTAIKEYQKAEDILDYNFLHENPRMFSRIHVHFGGDSSLRRLGPHNIWRSAASGKINAAIRHSNGDNNQQLRSDDVRSVRCSIQPWKNYRRRAHTGLCPEFYFEQWQSLHL